MDAFINGFLHTIAAVALVWAAGWRLNERAARREGER